MSKTTLNEVGNSLFKVLTIYCRQEVSDWNGVLAEGSNTSAYRGRYKLSLPQDWDCNKPTEVLLFAQTLSQVKML